MLANDPDYFAKDLARYRAVTAGAGQAAAAKYLKPNARVVLTISPGKKSSASDAPLMSVPRLLAGVAIDGRRSAGAVRQVAASRLDQDAAQPHEGADVQAARCRSGCKLKNGMSLLVIENHALPIVSMQLVVPGAGAACDPEGKGGLAAFTADLLDEGAGGLSAIQIAEETGPPRRGYRRRSPAIDAAEVSVRR